MMKSILKKPSFLYDRIEVIDREFRKFVGPQDLDLMGKAIEIEKFLIDLFDLKIPPQKDYAELLKFKRNFIQRYAIKKYPKPRRVTNPADGDAFAFMECVQKWERDQNHDLLEQAAEYAAYMHYTEPINASFLFKNPHPKGLRYLENHDGVISLDIHRQIHRHDFSFYDEGLNEAEAQDQAFYCIKCHKQNKDSCSKGLKDLPGCPLDQKISEMNVLKEMGHTIAALAVIVLDNPMVALTGHRICNDCRAACIFQKQDPVDVPGIETQILKTVLNYPFGFEIYSLLVKWNPLKEEIYQKKQFNKTVLVAGMGPAGIALSNYLLNDGYCVVGIDGLKVELWPKYLTKRNARNQAFFPLIENIQEIYDLPFEGFGGVCAYGITARWDKRLLNVVRLILQRDANFAFKDSVRLGSQITYEQTKMFDHVALCLGAGSPQIPDLPNMLAPGVHMASDFLMSLHIGKKINIKAPVIVIGAGLTAIDACTEAKVFTQSDVILCYRKDLTHSPAYRLNIEEVKKALQEGIKIIENATPLRIEVDERGWVKGLNILHQNKEEFLEAKTILIAIGTIPNKGHDLPKIETLENRFFAHGMSVLGDMNPNYAGSVVKAIKSAKDAHVLIHQILQSEKHTSYT